MTSIQEFNTSIFKFSKERFEEGIEELNQISDAIWDMLGETQIEFCLEQDINFS